MEHIDEITSSEAGLGGAEIRRREALRETYMGVSPPRISPIREEGHSPISREPSPLRPPPLSSDHTPPLPIPDPHAIVETAWVEAGRDVPMRVWYVENTTYSGYYGMDGSLTKATRRSLRAREASDLFVHRCRSRAINPPKCLLRVITNHLKTAAMSHELPSHDE